MTGALTLAAGRRYDRPDPAAHRAFGRAGIPRELATHELGMTGAVLIDRANNAHDLAVSRPAHDDMQLAGAALRNLPGGLQLAAGQTQVDEQNRYVPVKESPHSE